MSISRLTLRDLGAYFGIQSLPSSQDWEWGDRQMYVKIRTGRVELRGDKPPRQEHVGVNGNIIKFQANSRYVIHPACGGTLSRYPVLVQVSDDLLPVGTPTCKSVLTPGEALPPIYYSAQYSSDVPEFIYSLFLVT
jgi:hypothetical protein